MTTFEIFLAIAISILIKEIYYMQNIRRKRHLLLDQIVNKNLTLPFLIYAGAKTNLNMKPILESIFLAFGVIRDSVLFLRLCSRQPIII